MKTIATKSALCAVAVICLIIGAIMVWKIIQLCQHLFGDPAQTDPPPAPAISNVVTEAAWFLQPPSQSQPVVALPYASSSPGPCDCGCSFTFTAFVTNGLLVLTNSFVPTDETEAAFRQQLAAFGIPNTGATSHPENIQQINGVLTVIGDDMITVVIERSLNMQDWTPIQTNAFPSALKMVSQVDGPCSNAFYRAVQP